MFIHFKLVVLIFVSTIVINFNSFAENADTCIKAQSIQMVTRNTQRSDSEFGKIDPDSTLNTTVSDKNLKNDSLAKNGELSTTKKVFAITLLVALIVGSCFLLSSLFSMMS